MRADVLGARPEAGAGGGNAASAPEPATPAPSAAARTSAAASPPAHIAPARASALAEDIVPRFIPSWRWPRLKTHLPPTPPGTRSTGARRRRAAALPGRRRSAAGDPPPGPGPEDPGGRGPIPQRAKIALIALSALAAGLGVALALIVADPPTDEIVVTSRATVTTTETETPTTTTITTTTRQTTTTTTTHRRTVTETETGPAETTTVTETVPGAGRAARALDGPPLADGDLGRRGPPASRLPPRDSPTRRRPASPGGWDLRRVIERVGLLQIDSVNVLERAHYLPAFSRLGPYPSDRLDALSLRAPRGGCSSTGATRRRCCRSSLHPLLRWRMERAHHDAWGGMRRIREEKPELVDERPRRGPRARPDRRLRADRTSGPRRSGPWWDWSESKRALEWLFWAGRGLGGEAAALRAPLRRSPSA